MRVRKPAVLRPLLRPLSQVSRQIRECARDAAAVPDYRRVPARRARALAAALGRYLNALMLGSIRRQRPRKEARRRRSVLITYS